MDTFSAYGTRNLNVNQMNQDIKTGAAPSSIKRVDQAYQGRPGDESAHVHFDDGSALKDDGTWKHGGKQLSRKEKEWLTKWGWTLP